MSRRRWRGHRSSTIDMTDDPALMIAFVVGATAGTIVGIAIGALSVIVMGLVIVG